jgi:dynein heavy chain
MFDGVDKQWRNIMKNTSRKINVLKCALNVVANEKNNYGSNKLKDIFIKCNSTLEIIKKGLDQFLATKRISFPRFYFISDDELIEVLAHSQDFKKINSYLLKLHDNVKKLDFGKGSDNNTV